MSIKVYDKHGGMVTFNNLLQISTSEESRHQQRIENKEEEATPLIPCNCRNQERDSTKSEKMSSSQELKTKGYLDVTIVIVKIAVTAGKSLVKKTKNKRFGFHRLKCFQLL